jgi:hypothetical protein
VLKFPSCAADDCHKDNGMRASCVQTRPGLVAVHALIRRGVPVRLWSPVESAAVHRAPDARRICAFMRCRERHSSKAPEACGWCWPQDSHRSTSPGSLVQSYGPFSIWFLQNKRALWRAPTAAVANAHFAILGQLPANKWASGSCWACCNS